MEEYIEKSPLLNTQEKRNEHSQHTTTLSSEEKSNIMEESFIDSSQNNATKFPTALVSSTIVEDRITHKESDNYEKEPEKSEKKNNVEPINVLAGFVASDDTICMNKDKSEQCKQISLIESNSLVMSSINNQVINEALAYLNNFTRISSQTQNDIDWDSLNGNNTDVVSVIELDENNVEPIKVLARFVASDNTIYSCMNTDKSEQCKQISLIESNSLVMSSNNNQVINKASAYVNDFRRISSQTQNDIDWDSLNGNNTDVVSVIELDENNVEPIKVLADFVASDNTIYSCMNTDKSEQCKQISLIESNSLAMSSNNNQDINQARTCHIGETSNITKITVYAEIETIFDLHLEQFQVQMNCERETSSKNEGIYSIDQQLLKSEQETIVKISFKEEQSFSGKYDEFVSDVLSLEPDRNKENKSLNECVINGSENDKEYVVTDIDSPITDIFGSNCLSPPNTSIHEGINNAIKVLDANLENEDEKMMGETLDQERKWDDINKVVNISFEKYENFTADKGTLARPSTSETICQTDVSSFDTKSFKRLLQFDDDESISIKKKKVSNSSDVQNGRLHIDVNNDELFEGDVITPIDEEFSNSEEFSIMDNQDIVWNPATTPERRVGTIISTEQERETVEVNENSSFFDDEHDELNWSSSTHYSESIESDQLVPLPSEETVSTVFSDDYLDEEDKSTCSEASQTSTTSSE